MQIIEQLVKSLGETDNPLLMVIIFVIIIVILVYMMFRLAARPVESFQAITTDLVGDYRISNQRAWTLTEKLGELQNRLNRLEMEHVQLQQKFNESEAERLLSNKRAADAEMRAQEVLAKFDGITQELADVSKALAEARLIIAQKDETILGMQISKDMIVKELEGKVDSLTEKVMILQSVQKTELGEEK